MSADHTDRREFALAGTRCHGTGTAHLNLRSQLPLIAPEFPEVADCHPGTINLLLDQGLLVVRPDHRTRPIPWHPNFGEGERFDLLRIEVEAPSGADRMKGWLYIPHGSPHRQNLRYHELLLPTQIALAEGAGARSTWRAKRSSFPMRRV
jgi:hypothetical protein